MSLIIIEGSRKSGKTYLISQQDQFQVFKFPFNESFSKWEFGKKNSDIHWFGLGKEVMLHELNKEGFINKIIVDRGILTNSVWGVFQGRITVEQAKSDLLNFYERGLFKDVNILIIEGNSKNDRIKDVWDEDDKRGEEERALFSMFSSFLKDLGVEINVFHNSMDFESVLRFKTKISEL
jgi:hypothetical protein